MSKIFQNLKHTFVGTFGERETEEGMSLSDTTYNSVEVKITIKDKITLIYGSVYKAFLSNLTPG